MVSCFHAGDSFVVVRGGLNCSVLKRGVFTDVQATFFPLLEVLGSPKRGGGP